ncbi:hypothetical protein T492DRAFT_497536 [Pavlovales sp. CCMP2436]|nr:hypothetical protein T492DRAFT_497536 [Pavlovales sp. CCMP2436]
MSLDDDLNTHWSRGRRSGEAQRIRDRSRSHSRDRRRSRSRSREQARGHEPVGRGITGDLRSRLGVRGGGERGGGERGGGERGGGERGGGERGGGGGERGGGERDGGERGGGECGGGERGGGERGGGERGGGERGWQDDMPRERPRQDDRPRDDYRHREEFEEFEEFDVVRRDNGGRDVGDERNERVPAMDANVIITKRVPAMDDDPRHGRKPAPGHKWQNTESFDPNSTIVRPDLRICVGAPRGRYSQPLRHDDVILVPNFFCDEGDWTTFHKLLDETRAAHADLQVRGAQGENTEWMVWHEVNIYIYFIF